MKFYVFCFLLFFLAISFNQLIIPSKQPVYAVDCDQPWLDVGTCHAWCTRSVGGKVTGADGTTGISGVGMRVYSLGRCDKTGDSKPRYRRYCNGVVTNGQNSPDNCGSLTTDSNGNFSSSAYSGEGGTIQNGGYDVSLSSIPSGYSSVGTTTTDWSKNTTTNANTPAGSASYNYQDNWDGCGGKQDGTDRTNRCNFKLASTCSITSALVNGTTVNVNYKGARGRVRLWFEKNPDRTKLTGVSPNNERTGGVYGPGYYYYIGECDGTVSSCSTSATITAPAGTYWIHCDSFGTSTYCSGAPYITSNGGPDSSTVPSCSATDYETVTLATPAPTAAPTAPDIQGMTVKNSSTGQTTFSGTYQISGNQSTQQGKNWLNPITITLNATPGTGATSTEYYVSFYEKSMGTVSNASNFVTEVTNKLKTNADSGSKGFLLYYKSDGTSKVYNPFLPSNNWVDIITSRYYDICGNTGGIRDCTTKLYYSVVPVSAKSWKILFDKNFKGYDMYTSGYVKDSTNLDKFTQDIPPTNN